MSEEPPLYLAGHWIPKPDRPVAAGRGQALSVGGESQGFDVILSVDCHRGLAADLDHRMAFRQFPDFVVRGRVPQANGIMAIPRREGLAVRGKRYLLDRSQCAELMEFLARDGIP